MNEERRKLSLRERVALVTPEQSAARDEQEAGRRWIMPVHCYRVEREVPAFKCGHPLCVEAREAVVACRNAPRSRRLSRLASAAIRAAKCARS